MKKNASQTFAKRKKSFFYKLFFSYFIIFITLLPLIGISSYQTAVKEINKEIGRFNIQLLDEAQDKLEFLMNSANDTSVYIAQDKTIQQFLKSEYDIYNSDFAMKLVNVNEHLQGILDSSTSLDAIALYHKKSQKYILTNYGVRDVGQDREAIHDAVKNNIIWIYPTSREEKLVNFDLKNPFVMTNQPNSLLLIRRLPLNTLVGDGAVLLSIDKTTMNDALGYSNKEVWEGIYVISKQGELIYQNGEENTIEGISDQHRDLLLNNSEGYFVEKKGKHFFAFTTSDSSGWRYVVSLNHDKLLEGTDVIKSSTFTSVVIALICSFVSAFFFSKSIYKPIEKLLKTIKMVQRGDLNAQIESNRKDELGFVHGHFNKMLIDIRTLIDELYTERILKQEAELKVLQEKMNPHFLYNTLNAVACMASINEQKEIEQLIKDLSKYFRVSLAKGKDNLTFDELRQQIHSYLRIQQSIYPEKFEYTINFDDNILPYKVYKNLIEPIIENSIIHGIMMHEGKGKVRVEAILRHENIEVVVEDNGVGIPAKKLQQIRQSLIEEVNYIQNLHQHDNFALRNVNKRLQLYYGKDFGISIESELGKGTAVRLYVKPIS